MTNNELHSQPDPPESSQYFDWRFSRMHVKTYWKIFVDTADYKKSPEVLNETLENYVGYTLVEIEDEVKKLGPDDAARFLIRVGTKIIQAINSSPSYINDQYQI